MLYYDDTRKEAGGDTKAFDARQKAQEKSALQTKLSNDRSDLEKDKRALDSKKNLLQQKKREKDDTDRKITGEQLSGKRRKEEITRLQVEIKSLEAKLDMLTNNKTGSEYSLVSRKKQVEGEEKELAREIADLENKIRELNSEMSSLSIKINQIR